jgi:ferrous iron transport protein A
MDIMASPTADPAVRQLAALPVGDVATVEGIDEAGTLSRRLLEIGFFPGARVEVLAAQWPGGDPMAVRIGGATFALRRREAQLVRLASVQTAEVGP